MSIAELNLKPLKKVDLRGIHAGRMVSLNSNGRTMVISKALVKEINLDKEGRTLCVANDKKRWFIAVGGPEDGFVVKQKKHGTTKYIGLGKDVFEKMQSDLNHTPRIAFRLSDSREPSGGFLWYEILPNK